MANLIVAKEYLDNGYSVCFCKDDSILCSRDKGIAFIAFFARDKRDFSGYSVADRIVGKAAAYIYTILNVKAVYGKVMTEEAFGILTEYGIEASYETKVAQIINRAGDGICPMEKAVKDIDEKHLALEAVLNKIELLRKEKID